MIDNEHDKNYKVFLTHKKSFVEFLKGFIKEDWVKNVDDEDIELINKSFILKDYEEREADIVYKVKIQGKEIYFYILLELQSTVDFTMPIRLLQYMTELWKQHFSSTEENIRKRKDYKLPAIIPMLLYNGVNNWTAKRSFKEIQEGYELFGNHVLDFEYMLFDVNRYEESELLEIGNLLSAVFMLDKYGDEEVFLERFKKVVGIIKRVSPEQWIKLKNWVKVIIMQNMQGEIRDELEKVIEETELMEVEKMVMNLEITLVEMRKRERLEGKSEGLREGIEKGKIEVAKNALKEGADVRFVAKIAGLTVDEIEKIKQELQ